MASKSFTKNVLTILGGTSIALAVPLLASPALARLYTPEQFGQLALYMAVVSIAATASTGRYELAILIPRHRATALSLVLIALALTACTSVLLAVGAMLIWFISPQLLGTTLAPMIWMMAVPIGVFVFGAIQTLTCWQARQRLYRVVATARAIQAFVMTGSQLGFAVLAVQATGLVFGHIVGALSAFFRLITPSINEILLFRPRLTRRRICAAALRFADMPKFMVIGHLANMASSQMPVIMLALLYGPEQAGLYAFAERITVIPCGVITNSIGEIFRQDAAKAYHTGGNCLGLFKRTQRKLILIGVIAAFAVFLIPPLCFHWLFGEAWREAGQIAAILSIVVFFQSTSSPLSQTVLLASMHRADLAWQFFRLTISTICLYLGFLIFDDLNASVLLYALAFALAYLLHSVMQYVAAKGSLPKNSS